MANPYHDPKSGEFTTSEGMSKLESITMRGKATANRYRQSLYRINEKLRQAGGDLSAKQANGIDVFGSSSKEDIAQLDTLTKSQQFLKDGVVYRGVEGKRFAKKLKDGAELTDHGFMSTSTSQSGVSAAMKDIGATGEVSMLRIEVPRGKSGFDMAPHRELRGSYRPQGTESEVLFPRGTRLKITGRSTDEQGRELIHAKML